MATRWGSRIKMGEGPEYLCADEKEAGESEREREREKKYRRGQGFLE